jgi:hypothetical protein
VVVEVVKVLGTNLSEGVVLLVAFTSAGRTFATPVFSYAGRWI